MIYKPRNFTIKELTCKHIYGRFGDFAWRFFDERLLMTIDFVRDKLGAMYVNNWDMTDAEREKHKLSYFSQRGLRCTQCELVRESIKKSVPYASAHLRGQAVDFNIKGMKSDRVRLWILENYQIFPFAIRLEKNTAGWVHLDICNGGTDKVELFNP